MGRPLPAFLLLLDHNMCDFTSYSFSNQLTQCDHAVFVVLLLANLHMIVRIAHVQIDVAIDPVDSSRARPLPDCRLGIAELLPIISRRVRQRLTRGVQ